MGVSVVPTTQGREGVRCGTCMRITPGTPMSAVCSAARRSDRRGCAARHGGRAGDGMAADGGASRARARRGRAAGFCAAGKHGLLPVMAVVSIPCASWKSGCSCRCEDCKEKDGARRRRSAEKIEICICRLGPLVFVWTIGHGGARSGSNWVQTCRQTTSSGASSTRAFARLSPSTLAREGEHAGSTGGRARRTAHLAGSRRARRACGLRRDRAFADARLAHDGV